LSWAFQILPFLEQGAAHNLATTSQLTATPIGLYFCPSRRPPTQNPINNAWLMDYGAITPVPTRNEVGDATFDASVPTNQWCREGYGFWGVKNYGDNMADMATPDQLGAEYVEFQGVISRGSYFIEKGSASAQPRNLGYPKVSDKTITDGTSNTVMFAEKRINAAKYNEHKPDDDRGWSDGWDLDTIRSAACQPRPDGSDDTGVNGGYSSVLTIGAAHPGGFNAALADASVRTISYEIPAETFNLLAHRADGSVLPEIP